MYIWRVTAISVCNTTSLLPMQRKDFNPIMNLFTFKPWHDRMFGTTVHNLKWNNFYKRNAHFMVCFLYIKFRRGLMMNVLVESLTVLSEYYSFSFTYIQFDPLLLARNPGTTVHNLNMHICHKIIVLYTSFNCYPMHNLSLVK